MPADDDDQSEQPSAATVSWPTKRFTWSELTQIITIDKDLARLRRCRHDQQVYEDYMTRVVRTRYKTVLDFILCTKLDVTPRVDPRTGQTCAAPLTTVTGVRKRLLRNDFPYYFDTRVEHWILWKLGGGDEGITLDEIDQAKADLRQQLVNVEDVLHWVNPPALKSIPDIDHVHILCLRGETTSSSS